MKAMSRIWTALVVGASILGLTALWSSPAKALPLKVNPNPIAIGGYLGPQVVPILTDFFSFSDPPIPDGQVVSAVYEGAGPATGYYVYAYQIWHYSTSSQEWVRSIAMNVFTGEPPVEIPKTGGYHVYHASDVNFLPTQPSVALTAASWSPGPPPSLFFTFFGPGQDGIRKGEASYVWVFFHPLLPTTVEANIIDGHPETLAPKVYVPSPEPSVFVLLGAGLFAVIGFRRRYLTS
ncbi:MAG: PEP-CTERM sorting domain-containing protein [Candidatus Fervidibacter sp.]|uniref:PEP-CTERM sorting domain-containing protein n=1 Tax=Candidatus Fervidibacter sp. TaxID=3100871 RepID=UPI00404B5723